MKRRQRKPVLDINSEQQSESPRGGRWQNKYQQIAVDHPEQSGTLNNNPLASLLGQYNSDSETESDNKQQDGSSDKLNDKVNDFLKEIQMIAPEIADTKNISKITEPNVSLRGNQAGRNETSNCSWQECIDETTGYPYYWHVETNEVTWEMPTELKIRMNKCGQNSQSQSQSQQIQQTQHQTHLPSHAQQIQWGNYLPNTYPEMQTNIPEGMIPKEVVARNRNRQVGVPKNRRDDIERTTNLMTKKSGGTDDYESDEEKIEMITSFGNEESESETSDNDSPAKKTCASFDKTCAPGQRLKKSSTEKNVSAKIEEGEILSIGPALPHGIIPMIHGPENVVDEISDLRGGKNISDIKGIDKVRETVSKMENNNSPINSMVVKDGEKNRVDELEILEKLKNQAKLLQALGGEVPPSVDNLIKNDDDVTRKQEEKKGKEKEAREEEEEEKDEEEEEEKGKKENEEDDEKEELEDEEEKEKEDDDDDDDIISKIEKEMPVDHARGVRVDTMDRTIEGKDVEKKVKEFKISLVAGYSDDSDIEEETSPKKLTSVQQPLFPIMKDYSLKECSRGGESLLQITKDANNDKDIANFEKLDKNNDVNKSSNIGNVDIDNELTKRIDEYSSRDNSSDRTEDTINGFETSDNFKADIETTRHNSFLDNLIETPAKGFQRKKRIAFDVVPNKIARSKSDTPNLQSSSSSSSRPEPTSLNFSSLISSSDDSERHGFGFHKETTKQGDMKDRCDYSTGDMNRDKMIIGEQKDLAKETTNKKGINFVKGETTQSSIVQTESSSVVVKKPEDDDKELKELTDIVMEKIKFLSEGSQNISAIQIMIIQLQTLVGAWEAGDLKESYLYEWLKGTGHELARLEEAAAPPGWDCHWDRSHKRYYYRNSATGEAQWTYPEADVVGGTEEMDLCTTPPPPEDGELQIIEEAATVAATDNTSSIKTNDDKSDTVLTSIPIAADQTATSSMPMSMLTITGDNKIIQITRDEYKSLEAPPPPKISNPSPPPPPRIFAEDLKKGKKRRGSASERNYSDSKKEKTMGGDLVNANSLSSSSSSPSSFASASASAPSPSFCTKENVDPPLPPSPPKNTTQPPLPPNPPHPTIVPNPPNSEPLPPGVDPKDMPAYPLPATVTGLEPNVVYAGTTRQQANQIYATTIAERGITVPLIDHRSAIIQGQLMHYPTYQHLHNQAMIAAAGSLTGQEAAVQFMITDYGQVYTNAQVIAKPPVKSQNESLGSALDSFYSDIATIEKTILAEQDHQLNVKQDFDVSSREATVAAATPPPPPIALPNPAVVVAPSIAEIDQPNTSVEPVQGVKERKRKRTKVGIGKKQKEMSSMVAKWQKAQQDFEDSE